MQQKPRFAQSLLRLTAAALLAAALMTLGLGRAAAQDFRPNLGLAPELIDGGKVEPVTIPAGSAELMAHPMVAETREPLLTEVPGKPFLPVDPPPTAHHWWKYPVYAVVGFPRDLVDGVFGVIKYIPIVGIADYAAYEIVPTQALMRDPRDWHNWTGAPNRNDHGFYKGNSWGFFPSAHTWEFTYPSEKKARANDKKNQALRVQLDAANRAVEEHNEGIAARKLEARTAALNAIQQGDGGEAVRRMIPYFMAYPLDTEGAFSLLATGLALYAPEGPAWTAPMLWHRLNEAQPSPLQQTAELMRTTLDQHPDAPVLHEALIYVDLLLGQPDAAEAAAKAYLARRPEDARRERLLFETAMTARDASTVDSAFAKIDKSALPAWERQVLQARVDMLEGRAPAARQVLAQLQNVTPENPYLNYYLGCAELLEARAGRPTLPQFNAAIEHLNLAANQATHPALRRRAGDALAYARSLSNAAVKNPDLFAPAGASPTGSPRQQ